MPITRRFLDWDQPLVRAVAGFLIGLAAGVPADLSGVLVLAPTRAAGRRLREELVRQLAESGRGLLPPLIETPAFLVRPRPVSGSISLPGTAAELAAWIETLRSADLAKLPELFPTPPAAVDFPWAMACGRMLMSLRDTLVEGGLMLADVASRPGLPEAGRWRDLAFLEARFEKKLASQGLADRNRLMRQAALDCQLPAGITRLVVAGVPDPMPLAIAALERIAPRLPVDILIQAPAELSGQFDAFGRPCPEWWSKTPIRIPESSRNVITAADPSAQARAALATVNEMSSSGTAAVGVADPAIAPELLAVLAGQGLAAYDPAGLLARDHGVLQLLEAMAGLADDTYASAAAFLRHADLLRWLFETTSCDTSRLLAELDRFQNRYLPASFAAVQRLMQAMPAEKKERQYPHLALAIEKIAGLLAGCAALSPPEAARRLWAEVYGGRLIDPAAKPDREFVKVARIANAAVEELLRDHAAFRGLSRTEFFSLFLSRLADERFYPGHDDAAVELLGWLELAWSDAPTLVLTGMNEGKVPARTLGDPFIPDALARSLGLRDSAAIYARDAFLLASLIESRQSRGRVCLIAGRLSGQGDPLKPSRLLLACPDKDLAARAAILFGPVEVACNTPPASISFAYQPFALADEGKIIDRLPVTWLRDYLSCPFRFYLKRVLGMERVDDEKRELDALDFGSLAHAALEEMGRDRDIWGSCDAGRITVFLHDRLDAELRRRYGAAPPLTVRLQALSLKERLAAAGREQAKLVADGWLIREVERDFSMTVGEIAITGRIDRIDWNPASGLVRLYDYKTSDSPSPPEKIHLGGAGGQARAYRILEHGGKARQWRDLQLPVYLLAMLGEGGGNAEAAYWNLPKAATEAGLAIWQGLDAGVLASARTCLEGVVEDIVARRFWPPAEKVMYDDFAELFCGPADQCFAVVSGKEGES